MERAANPAEMKIFDALPASMQRIIAATTSVVSRRGVRKLSMADIADAAGLSRATLYRYFATKDELLSAVSEYNSREFEGTVVKIGEDSADPEQCLLDVLDYHFSKTGALALNDLINVEPAFTVDFLRQHFARHVDAMRQALTPAFEAMERQLGKPVNRDLLAEAVIRMQLSTVLVPSDADWMDFPRHLVDLLREVQQRQSPKLELARN